MSKSNRIITTFLGVAMFLFGVLKFIDPFKSWYTIQVTKSELPFQQLSYWSGQIGEILVGIIFIYTLIYRSRINPKTAGKLLLAGNALVILMMVVAIYVHLHPEVPEEVLPLKISPPIIPGIFLLVAAWNIFLSKQKK